MKTKNSEWVNTFRYMFKMRLNLYKFTALAVAIVGFLCVWIGSSHSYMSLYKAIVDPMVPCFILFMFYLLHRATKLFPRGVQRNTYRDILQLPASNGTKFVVGYVTSVVAEEIVFVCAFLAGALLASLFFFFDTQGENYLSYNIAAMTAKYVKNFLSVVAIMFMLRSVYILGGQLFTRAATLITTFFLVVIFAIVMYCAVHFYLEPLEEHTSVRTICYTVDESKAFVALITTSVIVSTTAIICAYRLFCRRQIATGIIFSF